MEQQCQGDLWLFLGFDGKEKNDGRERVGRHSEGKEHGDRKAEPENEHKGLKKRGRTLVEQPMEQCNKDCMKSSSILILGE